MNCLNCEKEILSKSAKKFCSSCSVSFNNKLRTPRTEESKKKVSESMKTSNKVKLANKLNGLKKRKENGIHSINKCKICGILILRRKTCSEECYKELKRQNAKERNFGGHTSKLALFYLTKKGKSIYLQSSYELKVAEELDKNNIEWERPKPLKWEDKNKELHRYYPDFYLSKYNTFLDTKNDFLIIKDEIKINAVRNQNNIKLLILNKDNLIWKKIKVLLE